VLFAIRWFVVQMYANFMRVVAFQMMLPVDQIDGVEILFEPKAHYDVQVVRLFY